MGCPTCTSNFILSRPPWAFKTRVSGSCWCGVRCTSSAITVIFICSITRSLRRRFIGLEGVTKVFSQGEVGRLAGLLQNQQDKQQVLEMNLTLVEGEGPPFERPSVAQEAGHRAGPRGSSAGRNSASLPGALALPAIRNRSR